MLDGSARVLRGRLAPAALAALAGAAIVLASTSASAANDDASCRACHGKLTQGRRLHSLLAGGGSCTDCHEAEAGNDGKCQSTSAHAWKLASPVAELCTQCHQAEPASPKVEHPPVAAGSCTDCHDPHASAQPKLLVSPPAELCTTCHDSSSLASGPHRHAPAVEGRCLGCHAPHGSDNPKLLKATGNDACLGCHDAKAPRGKGTPGPARRLDLAATGGGRVHEAVASGTCTDCHEAGHSSARPKLLKKSPPDLCTDCHDAKDETAFVHGAVRQGECTGCHAPHVGKGDHLLRFASVNETCFSCHEDDVTGRAVVHPAVADGTCTDCHDPHGSANRFSLKKPGKALCEDCHERVDGGKNQHLALQRYGCTGCHDPHASGNPAMLVKPVNQLCTSCHPDQADGAHVTSFARGGHKLEGGPDPVRAGKDFSCVSCHDPHGSDHPKLFRTGDTALESCDACHGNISGKHPGAPDVSRARPVAPAPNRKPSPPNGAPAGEAAPKT